MSLKLRFAEGLYRWNLSFGIISILLSSLTFVGVFSLVFAAPWYVLLLFIVSAIFGTGLFLDKVVRFWEAQATVSTVRNPYLVDLLYQKEKLLLQVSTLPQVRALRLLTAESGISGKMEVLKELDASIARMEATIRANKWTVSDDERVY